MTIKKNGSKDYWWEHIRRLARNFEETLNKKTDDTASVRVKLDNKRLDLALNRYEHKRLLFKRSVYGKNHNNELIDRHKIIALYIECFLRLKPFRIESSIKNKKDVDLRFMLVNELFSLSFMEVVINSWHGKSETIKIEGEEKKWFLILLNHFSLYPSTLDILSLAQIIYYIEKPYVHDITQTQHSKL